MTLTCTWCPAVLALTAALPLTHKADALCPLFLSFVVFEENSIPRTEFHPVGQQYNQPHYGLMTLHGVPKVRTYST